jgi:hypothetical protein
LLYKRDFRKLWTNGYSQNVNHTKKLSETAPELAVYRKATGFTMLTLSLSQMEQKTCCHLFAELFCYTHTHSKLLSAVMGDVTWIIKNNR